MRRFTVEPDCVDLPTGASAGARRTWIRHDGRVLAALSENTFRAYIYPLLTPGGVSVTAESPIDHPHHNSVTIGADHFDCVFVYDRSRVERATYNFYVNDTFQGRAPCRIVSTAVDAVELAVDLLRIEQRLEWRGPVEWGAPSRRVLARETRTVDVQPGETANIVRIESRLEPTEWDIRIGPTRHAYFTVRMADGLRVVDGGTILDADGRRTVQGINDNAAAWVDLYGTGPHGREAGTAVIPHPSPRQAAWYAHDWGSVAVNPFLNEECILPRGGFLDLGVTVAAHDGPTPFHIIDALVSR